MYGWDGAGSAPGSGAKLGFPVEIIMYMCATGSLHIQAASWRASCRRGILRTRFHATAQNNEDKSRVILNGRHVVG